MKLGSLQQSSVFLLTCSKRLFLPDCQPTRASRTARRQLNNQCLHQTHSALPEWQSRGERRWEKQSDGASDAGKVAERGEFLAAPGWAGGGEWGQLASARHQKSI